MTYAVRNTFFIAAFWTLVLASGFYYVYGHQAGVMMKARRDNRLKQQRLQDLLALEQDRSVLQGQLAQLDEFRQGRMGTLAAEESPGETFDYLLRELSRTHSGLEVDFALKGQDTFLSLERRTYEIKGIGGFRDFYDLLCFLEQGPVFYDVHKMEMSALGADSEKGRPGNVTFNLEFNGYNRVEGPLISSITPKEGGVAQIADLVGQRSTRTEGRGRILETIQTASAKSPAALAPRLNTEGLPEIDSKSKVLAVMPGAAVVKDQKGRTVRLRSGDRVFGGTLSEIDVHKGTLSFSLEDERGGTTRLILPAGAN
ncbi:MAG TPA: hypothetical protein PKI62_15975 [bacterium]|nr:hypothetical protein [bacterium]